MSAWFVPLLVLSLIAVGSIACERPGPPIVVTVVVVAPTATATPVPPPTPTATPAPTVSPQLAFTPSPTPQPLVLLPPSVEPTVPATPTATPGLPICSVLPIRGFGQAWYQSAMVREWLGCPSYPRDERSMERFGVQRFEGGVMLWVDQRDFSWEARVVLVLFRDNMTFARFSDTWRADQLEPSAPTPPAGLLAPLGRMGKVWREGAGVRNRLGWALEPEYRSGLWSADPQRALNGAAHGFERGVMYWIPYRAGTPQYLEDRWIYVLRTRAAPTWPFQPSDTWMEFRDTWRE